MRCIQTDIEGLLVLEPSVFTDHRGYFFEPWNAQRFAEVSGVNVDFVQDNESRSSKGVLRGLHFQEPPHGQAKLLRVISGSILDVAVDLRTDSPTYGKHMVVSLSGTNKRQFYIPEGFAHGFLSQEDDTVVAYKCSGYYHQPSERSLRWNDSDLAIPWGMDTPLLSDKDAEAPLLVDYISPFRCIS